jgi:primosomal replication protein N
VSGMSASAQNQVVLDVLIESRAKPRVTPAGVPVCELVLTHQSAQTEAGQAVTIQLRINALAIGPIAEQLAEVAVGSAVKVKGFLASRSARNDLPVLHLVAIKPAINPPESS